MKPKPLTEEERQKILDARDVVDSLAAELETHQPGPFEIQAFAQRLRDGVAPLGDFLVKAAPAAEEGGEA
jgi:hypothetical protein